MTKIFATGVTGYIGGDAIYAVANAHPEYDITCLVRNSDKGAQVAKEYPKIKLVYGDLDSVDLIEEESKNADIVLSKSFKPIFALSEIEHFIHHNPLAERDQTAHTQTMQ